MKSNKDEMGYAPMQPIAPKKFQMVEKEIVQKTLAQQTQEDYMVVLAKCPSEMLEMLKAKQRGNQVEEQQNAERLFTCLGQQLCDKVVVKNYEYCYKLLNSKERELIADEKKLCKKSIAMYKNCLYTKLPSMKPQLFEEQD